MEVEAGRGGAEEEVLLPSCLVCAALSLGPPC